MTRDRILAIDNGTQSVRALLFDPRGNLLAKSRVPIEPYFSTQPGYAEQNPEVFWQAVCDACQQLWQMPGVSKDSIAGVALTTQRGTIINLDQNGQPLRPALVWLDQRRTENLKPIGGTVGTGVSPVRHDADGGLSAGRSRSQLDSHVSSRTCGTTRTNICCCPAISPIA